MKYLKRHTILESKESDQDFLDDCFAELIDMGICRVGKGDILDKPGYQITIEYRKTPSGNQWGDFTKLLPGQNPKLLDELVESNKRELDIFEMVKEALSRVAELGYHASISHLSGEVAPEGKSIVVSYISIQIAFVN